MIKREALKTVAVSNGAVECSNGYTTGGSIGIGCYSAVGIRGDQVECVGVVTCFDASCM